MGSGEVAVVLPQQATQLESLPRLLLLQRQAQALGQELAIVTRNRSIRRNAKLLGIPFYNRDSALRGRRWRMGRAPSVSPAHPALGLPEPPPWRKEDGSSNAQVESRPGLYRSRQRRIAAGRRYRRTTPRLAAAVWLPVPGPVHGRVSGRIRLLCAASGDGNAGAGAAGARGDGAADGGPAGRGGGL